MAISTIIKNQHVHVGDQLKVYQEVIEDEKTRTQIFEGIVIAIKGKESGKSFVVRKIAVGGVGVERIWPLISPQIKKVEVVKSGKVRRSKLYYLRKKASKEALKLRELGFQKQEKQKQDNKSKEVVRVQQKSG
jgi:large subunit ribosomal protein L19